MSHEFTEMLVAFAVAVAGAMLSLAAWVAVGYAFGLGWRLCQ